MDQLGLSISQGRFPLIESDGMNQFQSESVQGRNEETHDVRFNQWKNMILNALENGMGRFPSVWSNRDLTHLVHEWTGDQMDQLGLGISQGCSFQSLEEHDVKYLSMMGIEVPTGSGSIEVIDNAMRDVMGRPSWYGHEPKKSTKDWSLRDLQESTRTQQRHHSLRNHMDRIGLDQYGK
ncbi:hypothetical protein F2Q68_00045563 [Brassica cretica]|uniref:Uncharacterized protein n=1 Tax=Brassica cretica TaxID=69181 RepID=A0A8S9LL59_BRACR|nr:hypothetical protein F2Q68_00045563 [Brassica cretica]